MSKLTTNGLRIVRDVRNVTTNDYGNVRSAMRTSGEEALDRFSEVVRFWAPNKLLELTILSSTAIQEFYKENGLRFGDSESRSLAHHINEYDFVGPEASVDEPRTALTTNFRVADSAEGSALYLGIDESLLAENALFRGIVQKHIDAPSEMHGTWKQNNVGFKIATARHEHGHDVLEALGRLLVDDSGVLLVANLELEPFFVEEF